MHALLCSFFAVCSLRLVATMPGPHAASAAAEVLVVADVHDVILE
jgi:hypothetical protein